VPDLDDLEEYAGSNIDPQDVQRAEQYRIWIEQWRASTARTPFYAGDTVNIPTGMMPQGYEYTWDATPLGEEGTEEVQMPLTLEDCPANKIISCADLGKKYAIPINAWWLYAGDGHFSDAHVHVGFTKDKPKLRSGGDGLLVKFYYPNIRDGHWNMQCGHEVCKGKAMLIDWDALPAWTGETKEGGYILWRENATLHVFSARRVSSGHIMGNCIGRNDSHFGSQRINLLTNIVPEMGELKYIKSLKGMCICTNCGRESTAFVYGSYFCNSCRDTGLGISPAWCATPTCLSMISRGNCYEHED
jgi:hypothetical protein